MEHELIQAYFRKPVGDEIGEFRTVAEVIQTIGMGSIGQKITPVAVGKALKELGFEYKRYNMARGYIVIQLSADEVIAQRRRIATDR